MLAEILAPVGLFYGIREAGGSVWLSLAAGAVFPAVSSLAATLRRRRANAMNLLMLAALATAAALSLVTGSTRVLLAREGLVTAAWAAFMFARLLARSPATFTVSRPLLEGRRVFDPAARAWVRPSGESWDELWEQLPMFRRIWRVCTVIWATAILADAVIRIVMAYALPFGVAPALGGALWPVTFAALQMRITGLCPGRHLHPGAATAATFHPATGRPGRSPTPHRARSRPPPAAVIASPGHMERNH